MAIRAYYDGSGKVEDQNCKFLTLAGYVGTDDSWRTLEAEWREILIKHYAPRSDTGSPYFHMKEAVPGWDGYKGWTYERLRPLWIDLVNLLSRIDRANLIGFSCTVDLDGHRSIIPHFTRIKTPIEICIDFSFGRALGMLSDQHGEMKIIFDRDEPFFPVMDALWKSNIWWAKYVSALDQTGDMRSSHGTQAADTLAWLGKYIIALF